MLIKICGLTRVADARLAEELGAHFLGVIMAGGPRNLSETEAHHILGTRRHDVRRVAVFATQSSDEIAGVADRLRLDVVQLHGDPDPEAVAVVRARVECAIWPVARIDGASIPSVAHEIADAAGALLLDARVVGTLGGAGVPLDWSGLQASVGMLRTRVPNLQLILAGGLRAGNIAEAVSLLQPDVVDVSSGVESAPGIKDAAALAAFISAARATKHPTPSL